MDIFSRLFRRPPKRSRMAVGLDGVGAWFGQFGTNAYESLAVQQAIKCIVDEVKKLIPTHIRVSDNYDPVPVKSTIQDVLDNPNPLMTTAEFLEKTTWLLLLNYNAFIIPTYYTWVDERTGAERRYYEALYPIKPQSVEFIQDEDTGELYVHFYFTNGYDTTVKYSDVIHIKYNYSVNEYMGGNLFGQPDHAALLKTLQLNEDLLSGVAKAMKSSYAVNGVVKYNTIIDDGTMEENLRRLEQKLQNNESGFLPIDLKSEFVPLERKTNLVDEDTLKFIDEKILRNWGVPLCILTGDYNKEEYAAFYQKTLEPLIITFSQAFTKKMFTTRERAFGNKIKLYPKELVFMTVQQTLEMIEMLSPTGAMFENEKRVALGLRPSPELVGKRYMSLNWIDADKAAEYQTGEKVNVDVVDEQKTTTDI